MARYRKTWPGTRRHVRPGDVFKSGWLYLQVTAVYPNNLFSAAELEGGLHGKWGRVYTDLEARWYEYVESRSLPDPNVLSPGDKLRVA